MRRLVFAMALFVGAASMAAADANETRSTRDRETGGSVAAQPSKSFPTVAKNQRRPIGTEAIGDPWENDWPDPEGGGGVAVCVKKHYCTGGTICATGTCEPDETKSGCKSCASTKCKNVRCDS